MGSTTGRREHDLLREDWFKPRVIRRSHEHGMQHAGDPHDPDNGHWQGVGRSAPDKDKGQLTLRVWHQRRGCMISRNLGKMPKLMSVTVGPQAQAEQVAEAADSHVQLQPHRGRREETRAVDQGIT